MLSAVVRHSDQKWVVMYVERWLKVPMQRPDGTLGQPDGTSRMSREAHVRICGGRRVRFPPATRQGLEPSQDPTAWQRLGV